MTAALGDLTQIPVTVNPTQALPNLGDVNVTLYNQDSTNLAYVSYQRWFKPGSGNSIPIQPLASVTISAKKAIYVAALVSGVQPLLVMPEGSQANPSPAQIAAQISALGLATETTQLGQSTTIPNGIAATGAPLLTKNTAVFSAAAQVVNASSSFTSSTFNITQIGYELRIRARYNVTDGTLPFSQLSIYWLDSGTGQLIDTDRYILTTVGNADTSGLATRLKGRSKGDQVFFVINNLDSAKAVTYSIQLVQNSRVYTNENLAWVSNIDLGNPIIPSAATNGAVPTSLLDDSNTLAVCVNAALAAGATDRWIIPPSLSNVYLFVWETGVGFANMVVQGIKQPSLIFGASATTYLFNDTMNAGNPNKYQQTFYAGGSTWRFQVINNGAVAANYTAVITINNL